MDITLRPARICGTIDIPGSKSHTIRALLIALFANGVSTLHNALDSQDTQACIELCRRLGARITFKTDIPVPTLVIDSTAIASEKEEITIDCANSGTTLYIASAMCAAGCKAKSIRFTGDEQLSKRPIEPLLDSLRDLGATIEQKDATTTPFIIYGPLNGGRTSIECRTSQYLSALLLSCPMAKGDTTIQVPLLNEKPYVRMSQYWLEKQKIDYTCNDKLSLFHIKGNQSYKPFEEHIGGDYSSATFFFCAAAMTGGTITVNGLDRSDPQGDKAVLSVLEKMGCTVEWKGNGVSLKGPQKLKAGMFDLNDTPDALPALAIASCFADGEVKLYNVKQARLKETDRIATMARCINELGGNAVELDDGIEIHPVEGFTAKKIDGCNDHRIVMAMALASLRCAGGLTIRGAQAADVTFPTFFGLLSKVSVPKEVDSRTSV